MRKDSDRKKNSFLKILLKVLFFLAVVIGTILVINYFTNDSAKDSIDDLLGIDPDATTQQEESVAENSTGISIPGFEKLIFELLKFSN